MDRREGREEEGICRTNVKLLPTALDNEEANTNKDQSNLAKCVFWVEGGLYPLNIPFLWGKGPHLTQCLIGPHMCTCQMASKSVERFKQGV